MRNKLTTVLILICLTHLASARALQLQEKVPDRYVVVKGDTLWDISKRFLKQPWRWPEIWKLNKEEVKNPHWIYPGDVIVLERANGRFCLKLLNKKRENTLLPVEKRSPEVRVSSISEQAIPSIPHDVIAPFLSKPLIIEPTAFQKAPRIVQGSGERVVFSKYDLIYAVDMKDAKPAEVWHVYRDGKTIVDPDTKRVLGHEVYYLGDAQVTLPGPVTTIRVLSTTEEIAVGHRLVKADKVKTIHFAPHLPTMPIKAHVASVYGDAINAAPYASVVINQGAHHGLEAGHILFAYGKEQAIQGEEKLQIPPIKIGNLFIYEVFPTFAYALVLDSTQPVSVGDIAQVTPEDLESV